MKKTLSKSIIPKSKKIIFFDADGTLWYPKKTKHTEKPHWVYTDPTIKDHHEHIMMIPGALRTLRALKKAGHIIVILSTHPQEVEEAYRILRNKVAHFKLTDLFTEVHATRHYHASKGEYMVEILKRLKIPKSQALIVGDNYVWDYKPARDVGIDALLIETDYMKKGSLLKTIKKIEDVLLHIKI